MITAVTLNSASIRFFDIDQKKKGWQLGPEVMQFWCPGGTFALFGDAPSPNDSPTTVGKHPFMSGNVGPAVSVETGFTQNSLTKTTYPCPPNEPVTLWSGRAGKDSDNPTSSIASTLTIAQETSMVEVNYYHVSCFDVTLANLPPKYHQMDNGKTGNSEVSGWPFKSASEGGNPLNGTTEIQETNFGLNNAACDAGVAGRNWLLSGSCPGTLCDQKRFAEAVSLHSRPTRAFPGAAANDADAPSHRLWSRRVTEESVGQPLEAQ